MSSGVLTPREIALVQKVFDQVASEAMVGDRRGRRGRGRGCRLAHRVDHAPQSGKGAADQGTDPRRQHVEDNDCGNRSCGKAMVGARRPAGTSRDPAGDISADEGGDDPREDEPDAEPPIENVLASGLSLASGSRTAAPMPTPRRLMRNWTASAIQTPAITAPQLILLKGAVSTGSAT